MTQQTFRKHIFLCFSDFSIQVQFLSSIHYLEIQTKYDLIFKLSQRTQQRLKSKQFTSEKERQTMEKGCKVLKTTIYHQNEIQTL